MKLPINPPVYCVTQTNSKDALPKSGLQDWFHRFHFGMALFFRCEAVSFREGTGISKIVFFPSLMVNCWFGLGGLES